MTTGLRTVVDRLRGAVGRDGLATAADAELVRRHADQRDEVAFAELVHRHAPAVYAMCRRHLTDANALDDAFQAAFVLLAQKAGTLTNPDKLSAWLCGVADRVARTTRRRAAKRSGKVRPLDAVAEPSVPADQPETDLRAVLDDELAKLPPQYCEAITLCDVDGLSRRDAAKRLGIPDGTLSNRLARARALLGRRLLRRGVTLGAGLALSSVSIASVPVTLVPRTVSNIATGVVPTHVVSLATEGLRMAFPVRTLTAVLTGLCVVGVSFMTLSAREPVKNAPPPVAKKAAEVEPPDPEPEVGGHIISATYSRDGKWLALAEVKGLRGEGANQLTVYDTNTWKPIHRIKRDDEKPYSWAMRFSADGKTLYATGADGVIRSWDTKTGREGKKLAADTGRYGGMALSPDGKLLAATNYDPKDKEFKPKVLLLETATGKPVHTLESDDASGGLLAFTADGKSVAVAHSPGSTDAAAYHGVIEWDVAIGKELRRIDTPRITPGASPIIEQIAYTRDGKQLIVAGGEAVPMGAGCETVGYLWVFDRKTGKVEKTLVENVRTSYVRQMAVSADGDKLYVGTLHAGPALARKVWPWREYTHVVQCWDTSTWELDWERESSPRGSPFTMVAAPNGKRVGVSHFGGFYLLDAKTGDPKGGLVRAKAR